MAADHAETLAESIWQHFDHLDSTEPEGGSTAHMDLWSSLGGLHLPAYSTVDFATFEAAFRRAVAKIEFCCAEQVEQQADLAAQVLRDQVPALE